MSPYLLAGQLANTALADRDRCLPVGRRSETLIQNGVQLDMFPVTGEVESLDPRTAIGPATRVSGLYRVRYGGAATVHQVYHDRHGWYCGEHGPGCVAVSDAVATARAR